MPLSVTTKAQLQIHFCVVLWGFTAILGKVITLGALQLVWWRMLLVTLALLLVPRVWRSLKTMPTRVFWAYVGIGLLVAMHWLTFYAAIKLANASVGATCIAITPVFLALIEPWVAKRKFESRELLLGVGVVPGVALVMGGIPPGMRLGLVVGVISAVFVAFFSACNKRMVEHADPLTVTCIELGAGTALLTLLAPFLPHTGSAFPLPSLHDGVLLLVLSMVCTLLPFAIVLRALRHVSAFATQLAVNLEPVYAVILAIVLLGENRRLDALFYVGVCIIVLTVFAQPLLRRMAAQQPAPEVLATMESRSLPE